MKSHNNIRVCPVKNPLHTPPKILIKLLYLGILISIISCSENTSYQTPDNKIKIDTVYKGVLGNAGSSVTVSKYKDSILIECFEKYWDDPHRIFIRYRYYDSTGQLRFAYLKVNSENDKMSVSYSWNDKWGQNILSVDSEFVKSRLSNVEISLDRLKPIRYDMLEYIIEKKYKNGLLRELRINDFNINYYFTEYNGKYYKMATDIAIQYSEWEPSSKLEFGRAYTRAVDYFFTAVTRIDSQYIQIAKSKHHFDLMSFLKKNFSYPTSN
jgi:hypothetical protein